MKILTILGVLILIFALCAGCSDTNPKSGVQVQSGDYSTTPGGAGTKK